MAKFYGAQKLVARAIYDLEKTEGEFVTDHQVARDTKIELIDVRDWAKTLEEVGYIDVAVIRDGMRFSLTAKGRLAVRADSAVNSLGSGQQIENRFLADFARQDTVIVLGRFLEKFRRFEASGFIGFGDAMACFELRGNLEILGARNVHVTSASQLDDGLLASNLIILGGPDNNEISAKFLSAVHPTFECGNPFRSEISYTDTIRDVSYLPSIGPDGDGVSRDYGLIMSHRNPFSNQKRAVYIAGSFGYGTWAGARYIMSEEFLAHEIVVSGDSFECLVETAVSRDLPAGITLIDIRRLIRTG